MINPGASGCPRPTRPMRRVCGATGALVVVATLTALAGAGPQGAPAADALQAQRTYAAGLDFLKAGQRQQAEQEFKRVIDVFAETPVWDAAVLKLSELYFDAGDLAQARTQVEKLTADRRALPSTPMARVLLGRILLEQRRDPKRLDDAVSEFRRVRQYHPGNAAIAAATYYEAEARRLSFAYDQALAAYREVATAYPRTPWAARALLGEARCLVKLGRGASALEPLQQVRERFAATPEALTALQWNTILYRLFLKGAPAYRAAERSIPAAPGKLKDVEALLVGPDGTVYAGAPDMLSRFDAASGASRPGPGAAGTRGLVAQGDHVVVVQRGALATPGGAVVPLAASRAGTTEPRALDAVRAAVATSLREWLVADRDLKSILRYSSAMKAEGVFAALPADRLAIDAEDRVAVLDAEAGVIDLVLPDGRSTGRLGKATRDFEKAIDIAFDGLGFLYVLDREAGAVRVFEVADKVRPRAVFSVPPKMPGAFRKATAVALDAGGRLFIYDESLARIQVYQ